jgi:hypothetical protein
MVVFNPPVVGISRESKEFLTVFSVGRIFWKLRATEIAVPSNLAVNPDGK